MRIVLAGPPGSGKSTHAPILAEKYGVCHASANDLLRRAIELNTYIGEPARELLDAGKPIPDEMFVNLVLEKVKKPECADGYIIEGIPRNVNQLELMEAKKAKILVDAVILMDMSDAVALQRTTGRWIHKSSRRIYHETLAPPKKPGFDDLTNEPLQRQVCDGADLAAVSLAKYRREIGPVLESFKARNVLRTIDASQSSSVTRQLLFAQLDPLYRKETQPWWRFW